MWSRWPVLITITWQVARKREKRLQQHRPGKADMGETVARTEVAPALPKADEAAGPRSRKGSRKAMVRLGLATLLVVTVVAVWRIFFNAPAVPDSIVVLSGRIEGDDSAVAPKTNGRIVQITVREGDQVKAGQIIAVLDDEQVRAREQQARAALVAAQAK